jgi:transcriptional regulator with XRE-family HTH domain
MARQPVRQRAITTAIADARKEAGLSQRQVSDRLREASNFMQRIESGERDISVAEFIAIARALGIDPCVLLQRTLQ